MPARSGEGSTSCDASSSPPSSTASLQTSSSRPARASTSSGAEVLWCLGSSPCLLTCQQAAVHNRGLWPSIQGRQKHLLPLAACRREYLLPARASQWAAHQRCGVPLLQCSDRQLDVQCLPCAAGIAPAMLSGLRAARGQPLWRQQPRFPSAR